MVQHPPIQIVDENDQAIKGADMFEAYEKSLIHRIVYVVVTDQDGRILLQKRSDHVANFPGTWDVSVGGHVDEGESYDTAASRELQEELGLKGVSLKVISNHYTEFDFNGHLLKRFNQVYKAVVDTTTPIVPDPQEVSGVKWLEVAKVRQLIEEKPDEVARGLIDSMAVYDENYQY